MRCFNPDSRALHEPIKHNIIDKSRLWHSLRPPWNSSSCLLLFPATFVNSRALAQDGRATSVNRKAVVMVFVITSVDLRFVPPASPATSVNGNDVVQASRRTFVNCRLLDTKSPATFINWRSAKIRRTVP